MTRGDRTGRRERITIAGTELVDGDGETDAA
jgi:hypothetical protein